MLTNVSNGVPTPGTRVLQVADVVLADVLVAQDNDETDEPGTVETSPEALERVPGRFLLGLGPVASIEESGGDLLFRRAQGPPSPLVATGERSVRLGDQGPILEFDADWNSFTVIRLDGTVVFSGTRLDDFASSPGELVELEGTYYSPGG